LQTTENLSTQSFLNDFLSGINRCGPHALSFKIRYENDQVWFTCNDCSKLDHFKNHIKSKNEVKSKESSS